RLPSTSELRRARDYVLGQIDLGQESTDNQMNWIGEQILGYGKVFTASQAKRHLAKVSPAQIRSVAREFLRPQNANLALVSPAKSERGLLRHLGF
ncbi:MAG TPA: insulinase family protein, partial [Verrucomicrobiae bacterium]|nr:insulinase family protein [Verrucomicrobiae bacterium]